MTDIYKMLNFHDFCFPVLVALFVLNSAQTLSDYTWRCFYFHCTNRIQHIGGYYENALYKWTFDLIYLFLKHMFTSNP